MKGEKMSELSINSLKDELHNIQTSDRQLLDNKPSSLIDQTKLLRN